MKKVVSVLCTVVLLALMLCLVGCGDNADSGESGLDGKYRMTEMTDGPLHITADQLDYEVILEISGDTATLKGLSGAEVTSTFTVDAGAHTFKWEDGSESTFTLEGKKLTVDGSVAMTFEKQ